MQKKMIDGHEARVALIGAGVFGTALAACALANGNQVTIYDVSDAKFEQLKKDETLRGAQFVKMDESVRGLAAYDLILFAPPSQALRAASEWMLRCLKSEFGSLEAIPKLWVLSAAKGIERKTLVLPNQILASVLPHSASVGALSGPSFAKELRAGLPTAVVVASKDAALTQRTNDLLHRPFFRVYESSDVVGVEVGGALKNVIAIAAGVSDGLKLGNNARAAVITRGLGEIAQVGVKLGADPMTFLGLSGLGDLILTCTGDLSRNRQFGLHLAIGERKEDIIKNMGQTIEGVTTTESAYQVALKNGLDTPILATTYSVIYENHPIDEAFFTLLNRNQKGEFDWVNA